LRDYTATKQAEAVQQSWVSATETFRNSIAGSDWPGGTRNRQKLGECLLQLGLSENPSAESLAKGFEYMKKNHMLVDNEEIAQRDAVLKAQTPAELRAAVGYRGINEGGGFWGR
jgi:hypothetical protein